jgi:hypothetical protein
VANLTNAGPVTAQIVNLWVFDTSKQTYGFNNSVANKPWANLTWTTLKAGQVLKFTSGNATKVTVPSAVSGDSFSIWFVTARGNTVPLTKSQGTSTTVINAQTAQGIGSVSMDFGSFFYYNVSSSAPWTLSSGGIGYTVNSHSGNVAFRVCLTNFDLQQRNITLFASSAFWTLFPTSKTQQRGNLWCIVNVNGNVIVGTYANVVLQYNKPTNVTFASGQPMGSFLPQAVGFTGIAPISIALIGKIGSSSYGQNIPFVSINVIS